MNETLYDVMQDAKDTLHEITIMYEMFPGGEREDIVRQADMAQTYTSAGLIGKAYESLGDVVSSATTSSEHYVDGLELAQHRTKLGQSLQRVDTYLREMEGYLTNVDDTSEVVVDDLLSEIKGEKPHNYSQIIGQAQDLGEQLKEFRQSFTDGGQKTAEDFVELSEQVNRMKADLDDYSANYHSGFKNLAQDLKETWNKLFDEVSRYMEEVYQTQEPEAFIGHYNSGNGVRIMKISNPQKLQATG